MISFSLSGSTSNTQAFLQRLQSQSIYSGLEALAQRGTEALRAATPVESGLTAASWYHKVEIGQGAVTISWFNSNIVGGVNVAVILQYGHGTGTGGYVAGRDYINPAIKPVFDEIANEIWKKVIAS